MAKRRAQSRQWLARQHRDPFVARAKADGYRARSVYKLMELHERFEVLAGTGHMVELGAAPGAWTQYARTIRQGKRGALVAVDLLEMPAVEGAHLITGDFTEEATQAEILAAVARADQGNAAIRVILSDMAPNMSGVDAIDMPRAAGLAEQVIAFAEDHLATGGHLVVKLFHGVGFDAMVRDLRAAFATVKTVKPAASRKESREVYAVALNKNA